MSTDILCKHTQWLLLQPWFGVITCIATGVFPVPAGPIYAAAKAGVVHFTRSMAPRLAAHGIRMSTVCPQYVDTPLVRTLMTVPDRARAMMGPLYGQPLLQPQQVVDLMLHIAAQPLPVKGTVIDFDHPSQCVWMLLQGGQVVDPFAVRAKPKQQQQRNDKKALTGAGRTSASQRQTSTDSHDAAAAFRFDQAAVKAFACQQLHASFRKLQVVKLSNDFRDATAIVTCPMSAMCPNNSVPSGQVLIRQLYAGVNASGINHTSGRWVVEGSVIMIMVGMSVWVVSLLMIACTSKCHCLNKQCGSVTLRLLLL